MQQIKPTWVHTINDWQVRRVMLAIHPNRVGCNGPHGWAQQGGSAYCLQLLRCWFLRRICRKVVIKCKGNSLFQQWGKDAARELYDWLPFLWCVFLCSHLKCARCDTFPCCSYVHWWSLLTRRTHVVAFFLTVSFTVLHWGLCTTANAHTEKKWLLFLFIDRFLPHSEYRYIHYSIQSLCKITLYWLQWKDSTRIFLRWLVE